MCYLATIQYACHHWDLFQLHCDNDNLQLCERDEVTRVLEHTTGLQCLDCWAKQCERQEQDRLAKIDDNLANLAQRALRKAVSPEGYAAISQAIEREDRIPAEAAARARERRRKQIEAVRNYVRKKAMGLWREEHSRVGGGDGDDDTEEEEDDDDDDTEEVEDDDDTEEVEDDDDDDNDDDENVDEETAGSKRRTQREDGRSGNNGRAHGMLGDIMDVDDDDDTDSDHSDVDMEALERFVVEDVELGKFPQGGLTSSPAAQSRRGPG